MAVPPRKQSQSPRRPHFVLSATNRLKQKAEDETTTTSIPLKEKKKEKDNSTKAKKRTMTEEEGEVIEDDDESDLTTWIKGLGRWPLPPPERTTTTTSSSAESSLGNDEDFSAEEQQAKNQPSTTKAESENNKDNQNEFYDTIATLVGSNNKTTTTTDTFFFSPISRVVNLEALLAFTQTSTATSENVVENVDYDQEQLTLDLKEKLNDYNDVESNSSSTTAAAAYYGLQDFNATALEELSNSAWGWMDGLRQQALELTTKAPETAEYLIRRATTRIESIVDSASSAVSPSALEALIQFANQTLEDSTAANNLVQAAKQMALANGLGTQEAITKAKDTSEYAANLVTTAGNVLRQGYVEGSDSIAENETEILGNVAPVDGSRALFADFRSALELNAWSKPLSKAAEMGAIAGAIYEETIPRTHKLGHSIVARGVSADVYWMITDSIANRSSFLDAVDDNTMINDDKDDDQSVVLVRTITIRGFDASDDTVDRDRLLTNLCNATPEVIKGLQGSSIVELHSGLSMIARAIYEDTRQYIDWASPSHRIVFTGHSLGGSVASLMLLFMTMDRGADWVEKHVLRVYTFGSPPIATLRRPPFRSNIISSSLAHQSCSILDAFGLPTDIVYGFVQPWDPIARLFTPIDPLYPLVSDIGEDGVTPWVNGPPRTLRPIAKAIVEAWNGWPRFRESYNSTGAQEYRSTGIQHILLADPTRYLADRFVAVTIPVPPVLSILRISSNELLPALETIFPLDVFEISYVPQAIRGFVHHFYPAYDAPLVDYSNKLHESQQKTSAAATTTTTTKPTSTATKTMKRKKQQEVKKGARFVSP